MTRIATGFGMAVTAFALWLGLVWWAYNGPAESTTANIIGWTWLTASVGLSLLGLAVGITGYRKHED